MFSRLASKTWVDVNGQSWDAAESNLTLPAREHKARRNSTKEWKPLIQNVGPNHYGLDSVRHAGRWKQFSVHNQGIVGVSNMEPFVGTFGLATDWNETVKNPTSFFDNMRESTQIKGVSWSYTAGSVSRELESAIRFVQS